MNEVIEKIDSSPLAAPPVIQITPPSRWWALPFRELWEYRELIYFFVWRDIKVRYKQTAIGAAWAVLQPFMTMLIFSLFFGKLAHIPSLGLPYPIFYYSALLPWMYFSGALQNSTSSIVENQKLVTKVYFPRLSLPFSSVLSGLLDFAISFLMFVVLVIHYRVPPTKAIFLMPFFLLARDPYGARGRAVARSIERDIPRRALCCAVSRAILDVRLTGGVSQLPRAFKMALAVWPEPNGGRDRRVPMVAYRPGHSSR